MVIDMQHTRSSVERHYSYLPPEMREWVVADVAHTIMTKVAEEAAARAINGAPVAPPVGVLDERPTGGG